ncbi:hypothetical protein RBH94_07370 [Aestuariibaculum sp. YM273]|uniref:hypothetical protein n=1 Tax=Aestuariibaculum sp. YM273 TaxID=3070659 RepID=UPI0027DB3881|nr:hypothetical protein [Aestuariibaculum sp. YM273]WMI66970.1 hypothetical protein RBH94_07370 [Aestuariibaculum sp. YM273]
MNYKKISRYVVLAVLFFLPVTFLLFLYPATHNYTPLDIVNTSVIDIDGFTSEEDGDILLKDHITVLGFLGINPMDNAVEASNLKELVYDKFKGFKKFQIVLVVPNGTEQSVEKLKEEVFTYEDLKFWHFVYGTPEQIEKVYASLKSEEALGARLETNKIFIIDKDLYQRGRFDDREDREKEKNNPVYGLYAYNTIEVAEIKNKMSDDLRILFTEYRQKRKGEFDSSSRRENDLKNSYEEE